MGSDISKETEIAKRKGEPSKHFYFNMLNTVLETYVSSERSSKNIILTFKHRRAARLNVYIQSVVK